MPASFFSKFPNGFRLISGATLNSLFLGLMQFGGSVFGSVGSMLASSGNMAEVVGNPAAANGADTTDDILWGFALPAGSFDKAGRGINFSAFGNFGATVNNKRIKVWINPTMSNQTVDKNGNITGGTVTGAGTGVLLLDTGVLTDNATGWNVLVNFFKTGLQNSNTQVSQGSFIHGTTHGGVNPTTFPTQPENATMNFVFTGSSPTTGAANDVVLNQAEVTAFN